MEDTRSSLSCTLLEFLQGVYEEKNQQEFRTDPAAVPVTRKTPRLETHYLPPLNQMVILSKNGFAVFSLT